MVAKSWGLAVGSCTVARVVRRIAGLAPDCAVRGQVAPVLCRTLHPSPASFGFARSRPADQRSDGLRPAVGPFAIMSSRVPTPPRAGRPAAAPPDLEIEWWCWCGARMIGDQQEVPSGGAQRWHCAEGHRWRLSRGFVELRVHGLRFRGAASALVKLELTLLRALPSEQLLQILRRLEFEIVQ